jgi:DNA-binding GntR family transcriptional regulator
MGRICKYVLTHEPHCGYHMEFHLALAALSGAAIFLALPSSLLLLHTPPYRNSLH